MTDAKCMPVLLEKNGYQVFFKPMKAGKICTYLFDSK